MNNIEILAALDQFEQQLQPSVLTRVDDAFLQQHNIELWIKRDDLLHPIVSGNKWRKLKPVLHHAFSNNKDSIISMGGQYSNHLHALAYIGKILNISTTAFVRGERLEPLSPTLKDCCEWGMQLKFVSRSNYRELRDVAEIPMQQVNEYWLPEGGAVEYALQGVGKIIEEVNISYDVLCVPCGTATTLAGLVANNREQKMLIGFAALKGRSFLGQNVQKLLRTYSRSLRAAASCVRTERRNRSFHGVNEDFKFRPSANGSGAVDLEQVLTGKMMTNKNWFINHDYHFGGFARIRPELIHFIHHFQQQTGIELEPVYTGKMLFGIYDLIKQGFFRAGQRIIAVHTGGLQGNRGFVDG